MTRILFKRRRPRLRHQSLRPALQASARLHLAAPYFTLADPVLAAVKAGKSVQLLVGLNAATSPQALNRVHAIQGLAVRINRFHAKIYIFDNAALLGSSNLTDGGLYSNREAVICLDQDNDINAVEEIRALFLELWEDAQVLTNERFKRSHLPTKSQQSPTPISISKLPSDGPNP